MSNKPLFFCGSGFNSTKIAAEFFSQKFLRFHVFSLQITLKNSRSTNMFQIVIEHHFSDFNS
jgi:hypothetical protein